VLVSVEGFMPQVNRCASEEIREEQAVILSS